MRPHPIARLALLALLAAGPAAALEIIDVAPPPLGFGEDGGDAFAAGSEVVSGAERADIIGTAVGATGGPAMSGGVEAGDGGGAGLDLFAASDSGEVYAYGSARGGAGGSGVDGEPVAGDGADVRLWNAVDGDTSGPLSIYQFASGGDAGGGFGGASGAASSALQTVKAAESLILSAGARGGNAAVRGFFSSVSSRSDAAGGPAHAVAHGVNTAGEVSVLASASAGAGGAIGEAPGAPGGDARAVAYGRTQGDDHPVAVGFVNRESFPIFPIVPPPGTLGADTGVLNGDAGGPFPPTVAIDDTSFFGRVPFDPGTPVRRDPPGDLLPIRVETLGPSGAIGGPGGSFSSNFFFGDTEPAGAGGDATSLSLGIAEGNSRVDVRDFARGGSGGFQFGTSRGGPSPGGNATSRAIGMGGGDAPVQVESLARAGGGGLAREGGPDPVPPLTVRGPAGRSRADALGVGGGEVEVSAVASGPDASALSRGFGSGGRAVAGAEDAVPGATVQARAEVGILRGATVEAQTGAEPRRGARLRGFGGVFGPDAKTRLEVSPDEATVARALADEPELREALEQAGVDRVDALGRFEARQRQGRRGDEVVSALEIELRSIAPLAPSPVFFVGLFAPGLRPFGFESLHVTVMENDTLLSEEHFDRFTEARRFLDGALLEVGMLPSFAVLPPLARLGPGRATVRVELRTSSRAAGLGLQYLVASQGP